MASVGLTIPNLPSPQPSAPSSGPGTPMSGLSTVAIKDGHEGHRPSHNFDGTAERIARLSSLGPNTPGGYFDVNRRPDTPNSPGATSDADSSAPPSEAGGPTAGSQGPSASAPAAPTARVPSGTGVGGALALALEEARMGRGKGREVMGGVPRGDADTPASSSTTSSAVEQRKEARMIDAMTYDEDVVDTTDRTPPVVGNSDGAAEEMDAERMEIDGPGSGGRKTV